MRSGTGKAARLALVLSLSSLVLSACRMGPVRSARRARDAAVLRYEARLDAALTRLEMELCFRGSLWGGLIPGHADAAARLQSVIWRTPGERRPIEQHRGVIAIPDHVREGCLTYVVSLDEGGSLGTLVARRDQALVASVPSWLWRPKRRARQQTAELRFVLPADVAVSVPWARSGDTYRLDASAFAFDGYAAFGRLEEVMVEEAGVQARAALLGESTRLERGAVERWLRLALHLGRQSDGSFPVQALQILVVPQAWGDEPFGNIARGGGASVLLLVPEHFDMARLARDWVLPHELSHLLLPRLRPEDAWLSEGLATYYQEVLRARAGVLPASEALANIARALRSAGQEASGRSLCEESRTMHRTRSYRAVYWGGAGHWLTADVALRRESQGRLSLDAVLSALRREARLTPPYTARELLTRLDTLSRTRLFTQLEARSLREPFPAFEPALRALGADAEGRVAPDAVSPLAQAVFAPQAPK